MNLQHTTISKRASAGSLCPTRNAKNHNLTSNTTVKREHIRNFSNALRPRGWFLDVRASLRPSAPDRPSADSATGIRSRRYLKTISRKGRRRYPGLCGKFQVEAEKHKKQWGYGQEVAQILAFNPFGHLVDWPVFHVHVGHSEGVSLKWLNWRIKEKIGVK